MSIAQARQRDSAHLTGTTGIASVTEPLWGLTLLARAKLSLKTVLMSSMLNVGSRLLSLVQEMVKGDEVRTTSVGLLIWRVAIAPNARKRKASGFMMVICELEGDRANPGTLYKRVARAESRDRKGQWLTLRIPDQLHECTYVYW